MTAAGGAAELSADGAFTDKPDVAIVVFGETPYAEFQGDRRHARLRARPDRWRPCDALKAAGHPDRRRSSCPAGPLWINPEINASDAFVAAWLPGTEGGGVADVLIARRRPASRATTSPASCPSPGRVGPTSTG